MGGPPAPTIMNPIEGKMVCYLPDDGLNRCSHAYYARNQFFSTRENAMFQNSNLKLEWYIDKATVPWDGTLSKLVVYPFVCEPYVGYGSFTPDVAGKAIVDNVSYWTVRMWLYFPATVTPVVIVFGGWVEAKFGFL